MKLTFKLDADTSARLTRLLAFLEIPTTAIHEMAKEHLRSISDATEDVFIAEGHVYRDRSTAKRVAAKLLALYPGQSQMLLQYRSRGRVVREDFKSSGSGIDGAFPLVTSEYVAFSTALPRDHMERVSSFLAMLEIPPDEIRKLFRQTLQSEVWHEDWRNWTTAFVYPDERTAARVAKRIAKHCPADRGDIRLSFIGDGKQVTATFPRSRARAA